MPSGRAFASFAALIYSSRIPVWGCVAGELGQIGWRKVNQRQGKGSTRLSRSIAHGRSLLSTLLSQQSHGFALSRTAGEEQCISQGRALNHFIRPFIMTRQSHEPRSPLRAPPIVAPPAAHDRRTAPLRGRSLSARRRWLRLRSCAHLLVPRDREGAWRFEIAELRSHVQQRRTLEQETAGACTPAVEFRESLIH